MANPAVVETPEGEWTKVATDITTGYLHILNRSPNYLQTYRLTGEAAPSAPVGGGSPEEGVEFGPPGAEISSTFGIDIYVWAIGAAGKVRVDAL